MEESQVNSLVTGFLRTFVPSLVGAFVGWLATLGVLIEPTATNALASGIILFAGALLTSAYYLVVRLLAKKFPILEVLLGSKKTPEYKA